MHEGKCVKCIYQYDLLTFNNIISKIKYPTLVSHFSTMFHKPIYCKRETWLSWPICIEKLLYKNTKLCINIYIIKYIY